MRNEKIQISYYFRCKDYYDVDSYGLSWGCCDWNSGSTVSRSFELKPRTHSTPPFSILIILFSSEVAHDMDEDEYVFTSTCESSSPDAEKFNKIAKKALANKLRPKFQEFPKVRRYLCFDSQNIDSINPGYARYSWIRSTSRRRSLQLFIRNFYSSRQSYHLQHSSCQQSDCYQAYRFRLIAQLQYFDRESRGRIPMLKF